MSVKKKLERLRSLRVEHGIRAETLIPDLAFIGLVDDVLDATETAMELLDSSRPYRAYAMVRVAFEACQRVLVIATADDYVGTGTRAWIYYAAKDAALKTSGEDEYLAAVEEEYLSAWARYSDSAREVMAREKDVLKSFRRGSPDNFLGKSLAKEVVSAYAKLAEVPESELPDNTAELNRAVYSALCRDTHACPRLDVACLRIDSQGYVHVDEKSRDAAEVERCVLTGLDPILSEAIAALSHRMHARQRQHAEQLRESHATSQGQFAAPEHYLPDMGLKLLETGAGHMTQTFVEVPIQELYRYEDGSFTCNVGIDFIGGPHMMTLDFRGDSQDALESLLQRWAPDALALLNQQDAIVGLDAPMSCTIFAVLGEVQTNASELEQFIPLMVTRVEPFGW